MPKKADYNFDVVSESGNWNVAAPYVQLKIMKWLYYADEYEIIATFGASEITEEPYVTEEQQNYFRIKALERLHKALEMVVNNTVFAIKSKEDKKTMSLFLETLQKLKEYLPTVKKTTVNQRDKTRSIMINETQFSHILQILTDIKRDVLVPLNNSDLIFTSSDEVDPDELLKKIQEDIIHGG